MPDHKNQHFVPRCHLKPFSVGLAGKAINLFHIQSGQLIKNAALKSQCSKDYFYGEDLVLEKWLQNVEGRYAEIVRRIVEDESSNQADEEFLRDFSYLQYLRTDMAVRRAALAQEEMVSLIYEGARERQRPRGLTRKELVEMTVGDFRETVGRISDLKVCLLRNDTRLPFVTSDDPGIMLNRLYTQRLGPRWGASGISNAGAMFVLPLSPKFAAYSYDGDVYTCVDRVNRIVAIKSDADVRALNTLQFMKAAESIYFFDWSCSSWVKSEFDAIAPKRPQKWHRLHFAVKDNLQDSNGSIRYRVVHDSSERQNYKEALIHLELPNLNPDEWCSKIKFRAKPVFVDTKSGAGLVRRHELNRSQPSF